MKFVLKNFNFKFHYFQLQNNKTFDKDLDYKY